MIIILTIRGGAIEDIKSTEPISIHVIDKDLESVGDRCHSVMGSDLISECVAHRTIEKAKIKDERLEQ